MRHFIDPTVDCVFKAILGSSEHINLLIHFINSIVKFNSPITSLTIENPYSSKGSLDVKMHIVDIKAKDDTGRTYQIELQLTSPAHLPSRMLHNLCQIHGNQIKAGEVYDKVMPTISIWLLTNDIKFDNDYDIQPQDVKFHFTLCDMEKGARISQDISLYVVNLHRWRKPEHLSDEDYWLYFLNRGGSWKDLPADAQIPQLQEAMQVLEEFSEQKESFLVYQTRLAATIAARSEEEDRKRMRKENQQMAKDNQQMAEENQQMAEENQQMAEENQQMAEENQQMAEENLQLKEQIESVVINLLQANTMSIEQIAAITNLPVEQVKVIADSQD